MRYKSVTLERIHEMESLVTRIQFELNRNITREQIEMSLESLKEKINDVRSLISLEHDTFEQQFK